MERDQLIQVLADFAGPLGPFRTPEQLEEQQRSWLATLDDQHIPGLLSIITRRPDNSEYQPATWERFELELTDALVAIGRRDPKKLLQQIGPLLSNDSARPAVIEVIGSLGLRDGITLLGPLVDNPQLTTDELVRLACALGEIAGPDAQILLDRMRSSAGSNDEVQAEIGIALENP